MFLIFDTETTGLPKKWNAPITDTDNWPRCIQIAWQLHDAYGVLVEHKDYLIKPEGYNIPYDAEQIHGISTQLAQEKGEDLEDVLVLFNEALSKSKFVVGQNVKFDLNIMGCEYVRKDINTPLNELPVLDTCTEKTAILCQIPGGRGGKFKLPTLTELHQHLFNAPFGEAHNATADVEATTRCFLELIRKRLYTKEELDVAPDYFKNFDAKNPSTINVIGLKHLNLKKESNKLKTSPKKKATISTSEVNAIKDLKDSTFSHLHCHSQFSILQSTSSFSNLIQSAIKDKMPAVAMTDSGNMMGAFYFVREAINHNNSVEKHNENLPEGAVPKQPIIPILGCEFNVCENHFDRTHKDNGYQIVILAKNKNGYHNLAKMSSLSHTQGFYYVPRIDKKIIEEYKEDLIVLSGNLYGEIPSKILNVGEKQAEEALLWWKEQFGDDFYLEVMRHNQENENHVNDILIKFSKKHNVKLIASNNTFYTTKEEAEAHDILLCVKDGEKMATPKGRGRGFRYGLPNNEYYFKSQEQMKNLFKDLPEAITNTQEIVDKIEVYTLARDVLLPKFDIPEQFVDPEDEIDGGVRGENAYLKHLTFEGAKKRYGDKLDAEKIERLDFELSIIEKTGYPGYFLIVWDFILEARKMGVSVGPGRGSAAGSAVAYCLWITNIDPIKYDLLFERFLNPDRVSLPDIDIDFDDEGRQRVIEFVIEKYGASQVAQIITYGTMAAKSSIRDTARALDLPLHEADRIAKLIPGLKLQNIFGDDEKSKGKVKGLRAEEFENVEELRKIADGNNLEAQTIKQARALEGSVRNTGIHACGVIITPEPITNLVPVSTAKDSDMYVTQFDNNVVETAGLLKMDFLGLKTLTLIKDTVKIVKAKHGIDLVPDDFPLDDQKTYELFQKGETIGVFQYESPGMQKHMKSLKPTEFADLIAMNALYRPGPMEYIPSFIDRKHGREDITYDLDDMEEYLKETYGITVYQEQVMLLSQKLAGFTKGEADMLRKAMGKKIFALLEKLKPKFIEGGKAKNHDEEKLEKIWKDWEAFAAYAFNKSHSTCYAYIAYQTAYLKAHYPAEYMASVLSNNMNDIKQVTFFMEECKRAEIPVLGPDVNESYYKFAVNKEGAIRFGMGAIKGVGAAAVDAIVNERKENGYFSSVFDVTKRVDLRAANKKAFDGLVMAGGFDSFGNIHRAQYYQLDEKGITFIERAIRYGNKFQENKNSAQVSLFGEASEVQFPEPEIPEAEKWGMMEELSKEKELVGIYISGHPLDDFKTEIKYYCNTPLMAFQNQAALINKDVSIGGIITNIEHRVSKNGKGWATFALEDFSGSSEFRIFGEEYLRFRHFLVPNSFLYVKIFVKKGWNDGDVRLSFGNIQMLQDVLEEFSKKITLNISLKDINEKSIQKINAILTQHKGTKSLNFLVYDLEEKIKLNLPSRSYKVDISNEFIDVLRQEQINFKLN
ncbi:DNA polymerase III, alpha subunit [Lutibacter agarilyticus]|uniref:DNA polymerase III subunit alpha n=1 Tax=Lutibacter agarilyticus TaxID=1109740 RepID=A0A238WBI5_9FLAO|nr:DNA polymerase III subunit alpha [Lutibacter agarilyticus]SNR43945.1 DNA polymerase III, alpha subunit [Lutibacter agarilyticus]